MKIWQVKRVSCSQKSLLFLDQFWYFQPKLIQVQHQAEKLRLFSNGKPVFRSNQFWSPGFFRKLRIRVLPSEVHAIGTVQGAIELEVLLTQTFDRYPRKLRFLFLSNPCIDNFFDTCLDFCVSLEEEVHKGTEIGVSIGRGKSIFDMLF